MKIGLILLAALILLPLVLLQLPFVRASLAEYALGRLNARIEGSVAVSRLGGNLFTSIELHDVVVRHDGDTVLSLDLVELRWRPLGLLRKTIAVKRIHVAGGRASVRQLDDGTWNIARAFSTGERPASGTGGEGDGSPWEATLGEVSVESLEASVQQPDAEARSFSLRKLKAGARFESGRISVTLDELVGSSTRPELVVESASGRATVTTDEPLEVTLEDFAVELPHSTVTGEGEFSLAPDGTVNVVVSGDPLHPADLQPLGSPVLIPVALELEATGTWDALRWSAAAESTAGTLSVQGEAALPFTAPTAPDWEAFGATARAGIVDFRPAAWVGSEVEEQTSVSASIEADAKRILSDSPVVSASFDGGRSVIGGQPVRRFEGSLTYAGGAVEGRLMLDARRGFVQVDGRYDVAAQAYAGNVRVRRLRPEDWLGKEWAGVVNLRVEANGKGFAPESAAGKAHVVVENSRAGPYAVSRADIRLRVEDGVARVDEAAIDSNVADVRFRGRVPLVAEKTGRVRMLARVERLADLFPTRGTDESTLEGEAMLLVRAQGTLESMAVNIEAHALALKAGPAVIPDLDIDGQIHNLNLLQMTGDVELVAVADAPALGGQSFERVQIALSLDRARGLNEGTFLLEAERAGFTNRVRGGYELRAPEVRLVLEDLALELGGTRWENKGDAMVHVTGDAIQVRNLDLVSGEQELLVDGRLDPDGAQNLRARINRIQIAQFTELLQREETFSGQLDGTAWLTGTLDAPQIDSTLALSDANFGEYRLALVTAVFSYSDRMLDVALRAMQSMETGLLTADLRVPVDLGSDPAGGERFDGRAMSGTVKSDALSLRVVQMFTEELEQIQGAIDIDVSVSGTPTSPRFDGPIVVRNGAFRSKWAGVRYAGLTLEAMARGRTIYLERMRITSSAGGSLSAKGTFPLPTAETSGEIDARIAARNFGVIENDLVETEIDADLSLTGTLRAPVLRGWVRPERLVISPASEEKQLEPLEFSHPGIRVISPDDTDMARAEIDADSSVSILKSARVDIEVRLQRNAWIRNDSMNIELAGTVRAFKSAGEPNLRFVGEITTVRGFYRTQGKRLEIAEGSINLTGTSEINPLLDITLTYEVPDYEVAAHVTGTAQKPSLTLTSNPPLEQADIAAVLLFGKPFDRLGGGEQAEMRGRVGQLLGGLAAEQLRKSLGGRFGIDTLEIEPAEGEGTGGAVGVGKYVSEDVFVEYVQRFGDEAGSEVRLEYYFSRRWLVQTSASSAGESGVDIFWKVKF